ncbi:hypothetical protein EON65_56425, partial [archaeon]
MLGFRRLNILSAPSRAVWAQGRVLNAFVNRRSFITVAPDQIQTIERLAAEESHDEILKIMDDSKLAHSIIEKCVRDNWRLKDNNKAIFSVISDAYLKHGPDKLIRIIPYTYRHAGVIWAFGSHRLVRSLEAISKYASTFTQENQWTALLSQLQLKSSQNTKSSGSLSAIQLSPEDTVFHDLLCGVLDKWVGKLINHQEKVDYLISQVFDTLCKNDSNLNIQYLCMQLMNSIQDQILSLSDVKETTSQTDLRKRLCVVREVVVQEAMKQVRKTGGQVQGGRGLVDTLLSPQNVGVFRNPQLFMEMLDTL